ncbi:MAG: GNAT family N-acetyltransferase [bacterium]
MINIRQARESDNPQIIKLLKELDLYYKGLELKDFWLAEKAGETIGAVKLANYDNFVYLEALGTAQKDRHLGVARKLLSETLPKISKDIYLYTIIPDFFHKFGFELISRPKILLPSKEKCECENCQPNQCVTMVKYVKNS